MHSAAFALLCQCVPRTGPLSCSRCPVSYCHQREGGHSSEWKLWARNPALPLSGYPGKASCVPILDKRSPYSCQTEKTGLLLSSYLNPTHTHQPSRAGPTEFSMRIWDYHTLVAATWDLRKELWSEMPPISAWHMRATEGAHPYCARPAAGQRGRRGVGKKTTVTEGK